MVISPASFTPEGPHAEGRLHRTFRFRIDGPEQLTFQLFDVSGRLVTSRAPEHFTSAGEYAVSWDPGHLGGGVYCVRLAGASGKVDGTRWAILR